LEQEIGDKMIIKWINITIVSVIIGYLLDKIEFYGYSIYFTYVLFFGDSGPDIINKITDTASTMSIPITMLLGQTIFLIYWIKVKKAKK
jgi:hypothetical protein